jgi:PAS domain S-box-containing protein
VIPDDIKNLVALIASGNGSIFREIIEVLPVALYITDARGQITYFNPATVKLTGSVPELGTTQWCITKRVFTPDGRLLPPDQCLAAMSSASGDVVRDLEYVAERPDGTRFWFTPRSAALRDTHGQVMGGVTLLLDITERKFEERSSLLLSAIIDSSDDAIISKDLNGVITSWNKGAERLFGYTAEQAIGQPVATLLIPPDRQNEEPDILARLRRGEHVSHFETKRKRKDGVLLDISLTISPVRNAQGIIVGASKIARDISENKRTQAALLASEASFRQLADAMPQIVWTARADGYVDYYNERWYQFTGFNRDTYGNMSWEPLLHPDDLQQCRSTWLASIQSGQPYNIEYRLFDRHERRWRWFIGRALPIRDFTGTIVKWFGTCTDIDEQKTVQDDLRHANQDLEQFAFSASHDLQEPLRSIKIYSELLFKRYSNLLDEDAQEFIKYICSAATRMEMLVRDLLTYTQITRIEQPCETVDANAALNTALANLATAINEANAKITTVPLPSLSAYDTHLQQLFQNLIGNAIKYRSPARPPVVHISVERQNGEWMFAVSDNGIGIDPQHKDSIFGLFKRLHASDEYGGTGIGLAICQRIVDRYHGRIWVESEPDRGSIFRFTLPA